MTQRLLVTGGAGKVATLLRPRLARTGRLVRLLDLHAPATPAADGEEFVVGTINDLDGLTTACAGVDAVIHLGGHSKETAARDIIDVNIHGSYTVFEAARRAGVTRVLYASSHHAAGFWHRSEAPPGGLPADVAARPDTFYGWSKASGEAVGRLYADRFGMDVICLRIGSWCPVPPDPRGLAQWLSPDDGARLVEAAVATPSPGYRVIWGISRNTRRWCSLDAGVAIGYQPRDDAETYAADVLARHMPSRTDDFLGGTWPTQSLGALAGT